MGIKRLFNKISKVNELAIPLYEKLPGWCFPQRPRRFQAYGLGLPKTGTVSLHLMFNNKHYRSAHQPEGDLLLPRIWALTHGQLSHQDFLKYMKHRDRRMGLEMDSGHLNYYLIEILLEHFKEAKFILTIRDCYSWLDSIINHHVSRPFEKQTGMLLQHLRFKSDITTTYAKEEQILAEKNLYPIAGYFSWWKEHTHKVLTTIPENKLLIIKTKELNQSIPQIEIFLGIPTGTLQAVHGNKGMAKYQLLSKIDKKFLEERANFYCGDLMGKYFPEVTGFKG